MASPHPTNATAFATFPSRGRQILACALIKNFCVCENARAKQFQNLPLEEKVASNCEPDEVTDILHSSKIQHHAEAFRKRR